MKTLYVSLNAIRLSKRGKITNMQETETEYIFNVEGKKKIYVYSKEYFHIDETNKTITILTNSDVKFTDVKHLL